jgi:hypothetical protein
MTKETNQPSLGISSTLSRRRLLQLAITALAGAGLWLVKSENHILGVQAPEAIQPTPPPTTQPEKYVIGVPGVIRSEIEKVPVAVDLVLLKDHLASEIENYRGQTAISITDIKTGETIDVNGDRLQLTGCVANLFCALTVIAQESLGKIPREEVEYPLTMMVRHSNPHYGNQLVYRLGDGSAEVGVKMINYFMKLWGIEKSIYNNPPAYSSYCLTGCASGEANKATANEINKVLVKLARNKLYPPSPDFNWNFYAFWVMCDNKPGLNFMIPGEISASQAIVAHKVGWYYGQPHTINDVGIVVARDNRFSFAISCLHQNFDFSLDEQTLFYDPGFFLRRLAGLSYQTFLNRYG